MEITLKWFEIDTMYINENSEMCPNAVKHVQELETVAKKGENVWKVTKRGYVYTVIKWCKLLIGFVKVMKR